MSARQAESELSLLIIRALNTRGHFVFKKHQSGFDAAGISDILGMSRDGRAVHLETKLPGRLNTTTKPQWDFLRKCAATSLNCVAAVVTSVAEAIAAVETPNTVPYVYAWESGNHPLVRMLAVRELPDGETRRRAMFLIGRGGLTNHQPGIM